jgi:hypothetical protein
MRHSALGASRVRLSLISLGGHECSGSCRAACQWPLLPDPDAFLWSLLRQVPIGAAIARSADVGRPWYRPGRVLGSPQLASLEYDLARVGGAFGRLSLSS